MKKLRLSGENQNFGKFVSTTVSLTAFQNKGLSPINLVVIWMNVPAFGKSALPYKAVFSKWPIPDVIQPCMGKRSIQRARGTDGLKCAVTDRASHLTYN